MDKMKEQEMEKEMYVAPRVEVIAIEPEGGILCSSGNMSAEGDRWGGAWGDDI